LYYIFFSRGNKSQFLDTRKLDSAVLVSSVTSARLVMMASGEPRVVQGIAVSSQYDPSSDQMVAGVSDYNVTKGQKQPGGCKDFPFALIFYGQLAAIIVCAIIYGPAAFKTYQFEEFNISGDLIGYIKVAGATGVVAFVLAGCMLLVLMCIASILIKTALIFTFCLYGLWAAYGFYIGNIIIGVIGIFFFLLMGCYVWAVWSRIPFATANLVTALTAVKANLGLSIIAYFFAVLSLAWYLLWALVFVGIWVSTTCDMQTQICQGEPNGGYLFLLFLSFFFTTQVIQNCVHVTVAGTVGTWWFTPSEASCCCSGAVIGSWFRAMTTSFGSICFGSLLVAILQALRQLVNTLRDGDNGILICIADCILGCLESILEYFNKWAYVYVGLYGYSYLEAGKNVFTLFKNRGWEAIIADDLVSMTLFLVSLMVGLVTGGVGIGLIRQTDWFPEVQGANDTWIGFVFGFLCGIVICSVLMSVVASAVNTVIVCFAEGPAEFEQNHPELSRKMRATWIKAYPGCF